jgi:hypothetical protein
MALYIGQQLRTARHLFPAPPVRLDRERFLWCRKSTRPSSRIQSPHQDRPPPQPQPHFLAGPLSTFILGVLGVWLQTTTHHLTAPEPEKNLLLTLDVYIDPIRRICCSIVGNSKTFLHTLEKLLVLIRPIKIRRNSFCIRKTRKNMVKVWFPNLFMRLVSGIMMLQMRS